MGSTWADGFRSEQPLPFARAVDSRLQADPAQRTAVEDVTRSLDLVGDLLELDRSDLVDHELELAGQEPARYRPGSSPGNRGQIEAAGGQPIVSSGNGLEKCPDGLPGRAETRSPILRATSPPRGACRTSPEPGRSCPGRTARRRRPGEPPSPAIRSPCRRSAVRPPTSRERTGGRDSGAGDGVELRGDAQARRKCGRIREFRPRLMQERTSRVRTSSNSSSSMPSRNVRSVARGEARAAQGHPRGRRSTSVAPSASMVGLDDDAQRTA